MQPHIVEDPIPCYLNFPLMELFSWSLPHALHIYFSRRNGFPEWWTWRSKIGVLPQTLCLSPLFGNYLPAKRVHLTLSSGLWTSLVTQMIKNLSIMQETQVWSLGKEDPLEKEIATHSSILAWRIQWTEETARLQSFWFQSWKWLSKGPVAQKALHKCYLNYYCYYFIFSPPSTVLTSCLYYIRAHI